MPRGNIIVKAIKDKSRPTIAKIFEGFRKGKIFKIKAEIQKPSRWRPEGINTYEFKIHSIERKNLEENHLLFSEYEAKAVFIGMNGEPGNFPEHFCWTHGGIEHEIKIYFNARGKFMIEYGEYLTL